MSRPPRLFASDGGDPFGYRRVVEDYSGLGPLEPWQRRGRPRGYWEPQVSRVHSSIVANDIEALCAHRKGRARLRRAVLNMLFP